MRAARIKPLGGDVETASLSDVAEAQFLTMYTTASHPKCVHTGGEDVKQDTPSTSTGSEDWDVEDESPLELARRKNVKHNKAAMAALQLPGMGAALNSSADKRRRVDRSGEKKYTSTISQGSVEVPTRKSSRVRGLEPEAQFSGGIHAELRDGGVVLNGPGGKDISGVVESQADIERRTSSHKVGDQRASGLGGDVDDNTRFLARLSVLGKGERSKKSNASSISSLTAIDERLKNLSLSESDVAKVTPKAATQLQFMPREDVLMVASADKGGCVGLWDINDNSGDCEGIFVSQPHNSYISGLAWQSDLGGLVSCAYDGRICLLDAQSATFLELHNSHSDGIEFSALGLAGEGRTGMCGTNRGIIIPLDLRTRGASSMSQVCVSDKKINTISYHPSQEYLLVTSSTSGEVAVWDSRKLGSRKNPKTVCMMPHQKSVQGAYYSPDGARVLTTSFDNFIRVWDSLGTDSGSCLLKLHHNNDTGRWIMPFRAIWASANLFIVGSMRREVEIFDVSTKERVMHYSSDFMTAIPARNCSHKSGVLVCGTASGRLHAWR